MYYVLKFSQDALLGVNCFISKDNAHRYLQSVSNNSHYVYKTYYAFDSDFLTFLENKGELVSL